MMVNSKSFMPYSRFYKPYSLRSILFFVLIIGLVLHLRTLIFQVISEETAYISKTVTAGHPIEKLYLQNTRKFEKLLARQSKTPEEAIKAYKKRYSRDPPPGFSKWVRYALAQKSAIIDDYDIIEERLAPFRAISPFDLDRRIKAWTVTADAFETIKIRDGKYAEGGEQFKTSVDDIVDQLPDMDVLLNWLDEPRIIGTDLDSNKVNIEDFAGKDSWGILTERCKFSSQRKRWGPGTAGVKEKKSSKSVRYVDDLKKELDICAHPEYRNQHGFLSAPSNLRAARSMIPFLSTLSLSSMTDIITPGLDYVDWHYLGDNKTVDRIPYEEKKPLLYWKGWSTGSQFRETTWTRNHRIRFVEKFSKNPKFNIGFSRYVQCADFCPELEKTVGLVPNDPPAAGFNYKFAMDLDGNGYSGRYYRLLQSNCLVFKQTLFEQWHDDRLVPWVHYVPVSMGMEELESAIDYFANDPRGKIFGERIAMDGQKWAKKVLRSVDMTIYTYRLLLEYAALFNEPNARW
ncbi:hypothetical protein H072_6956 [Dactylellina haptotyla CBS 200.50]|uniref:Glycosyl transferase CAP10 domain-containing protein n=1 Tax=Dactylellina haptotyla (strain CBS 200.50) TaxID=1284197 RepID=S8BIW4_DACHA|nr:hypothetical protein H072_6956 [Dactylellina haptotyla CBS 200.50]